MQTQFPLSEILTAYRQSRYQIYTSTILYPIRTGIALNKSKQDLSQDFQQKEFSSIVSPFLSSIKRDCPDGLLSKAKFLEVYSTFFPTGNPDKFCNHVFRSFDGDNSGKIDFKEFLLAINITSGGDPKSKLNWAFTMYDIDGNGTIEKDEMVEIIGVNIFVLLAMLLFTNKVPSWGCNL